MRRSEMRSREDGNSGSQEVRKTERREDRKSESREDGLPDFRSFGLNQLTIFPSSGLLVLSVLLSCLVFSSHAQITIDTVGYGWAKTSVNTVPFRKNSVVTHEQVQYVAYYNADGYVALGKRKIGDHRWQVVQTMFKGNVADAHNSISIMVDGDGYLHMAWDHHNNALHYSKSLSSGSLDMGPETMMIGTEETNVTYPEFHRLPSGDLIFLYRNGMSGEGNLVMNRYDKAARTWKRLHSNLIDGEKQRNAYWQSCIDKQGVIHVSWVWRETWDVATNHDMAYARSKDGGLTWEKTTGEKYILPINQAKAEYACFIPQKSELINQTSMTTDDKGMPYIATYWRPEGAQVPQYYVIYHDGKQWQKQQVSVRTTPFSLSGGGTKKIPISRPQVMASGSGKKTEVIVIYRDAETDSRISLSKGVPRKNNWSTRTINTFSVGDWEPSFDTEMWKNKKILHLFVQKTGQGDGEKLADLAAQPVMIVECLPNSKF